MIPQAVTPERLALERRAAARLELRRRKQAQRTVYGFYEPTDVYGGRLVKCLQEQGGEYVEVDEEPIVRLPAKLEPFLVKHRRFKVLAGGRGSGKSIGAGEIAAARAKDYGEKAMCLRENLNKIGDSVHALLVALIRAHQWSNFTITDQAIRLENEPVFKYMGLARDTDGVKSSHGFKRSWVEEAQTISYRSLEDLTPTIREAGAELWFTLNPASRADPISQRFLVPFEKELRRDGYYEDDLHLVIMLNYCDNPWHRELESERVFDQKHKSAAAYAHKWLGDYLDEVDNAIITVEEFDAAIGAHEKLGFKGEGAKIAGYDPSDLGPDDKGYALRHGSVVLDVTSNDQGDVNEGTDWALDRAIQAGADWFTWDGDGMGAGLKQQVSNALSGKHIDYLMFRGSEGPENPETVYQDTQEFDRAKRKSNRDTFANKRAQYYIRLADRFKATHRAVVKGEYVDPDTMISLSPDIENLDQLRAEVCRIPRKPNPNGKIQIMTKQEMAKKPLELPSPNMADALMMTMCMPSPREESHDIEFEGWT